MARDQRYAFIARTVRRFGYARLKRAGESALAVSSILATYGDRLVCVRYRYDSARGVRHKTVELIVETLPWPRPPQTPPLVGAAP